MRKHFIMGNLISIEQTEQYDNLVYPLFIFKSCHLLARFIYYISNCAGYQFIPLIFLCLTSQSSQSLSAEGVGETVEKERLFLVPMFSSCSHAVAASEQLSAQLAASLWSRFRRPSSTHRLVGLMGIPASILVVSFARMPVGGFLANFSGTPVRRFPETFPGTPAGMFFICQP